VAARGTPREGVARAWQATFLALNRANGLLLAAPEA
jgi:hypothetical protein